MSIPDFCEDPDACKYPNCACPVMGQALTAGCSSPTAVFLMVVRGQLESDPKHRVLLFHIDAEIERLRGTRK